MNYESKRHDLLNKKMKLDKFFTMYLDKFERKMDSDKPNTPIWKLYKQKCDEYNKVCQEIRNTEYWIKKYA
jgi:hypothetical protein